MTGFEIALLIIVLALVVGAARIVRAVSPFILNAIVGLFVLLVAEIVLGLEVAVTAVALLVVALGGVPGAILVILLSAFGLAFVP